MTTYKNAVQAAINAEHESWCGSPPTCGVSARRCREAAVNVSDIREEAFLAALPPSIVVDGKVVGCKQVARLLVAQDDPDASPSLVDHYADYYVERWLDAARKVAE